MTSRSLQDDKPIETRGCLHSLHDSEVMTILIAFHHFPSMGISDVQTFLSKTGLRLLVC